MHCRLVTVFNFVLPEGPEFMAIGFWFSALSFVYIDFPEFSESLIIIMYVR